MVIDTSAIIAILLDEPDAEAFLQKISTAPRRLMSASTWIEAGIVADNDPNPRKGPAMDELLAVLRLEIVPVSEEQARIARQAYRRYGKGRHKAGLNFGDCFAYALAQSTGEPLLYKGKDFAQTNVQSY